MTSRLGSRPLLVDGVAYEIVRLREVASDAEVRRLPYALRVLLENVARCGSASEVDAVVGWRPDAAPSTQVMFSPSRVLLHDTTGLPAVVDLAAMRDAIEELGGAARRVNPRRPAVLVIDHSLQVEAFADGSAMERNLDVEYARNAERYGFLRWAQSALSGFQVVPPNTGILHQVNLERLATVVEARDGVAFPDTLVGSDSHTTMINGLGVLAWGVGGIEAGAAMLGESLPLLLPRVVGVRLSGSLPTGATATDLVLRVTELLRDVGVVGTFVEYLGRGLAGLTLADRATLANMCPEYGATCGFFPVDEITLDYLRLSGRDAHRVALVEDYSKENLLWREPDHEPEYSELVELDLGTIEPSVAGPRRPQDRVPLGAVKSNFVRALPSFGVEYLSGSADETRTANHHVTHGSIVIAAITSCTNTSNPSVMLAAGLLAKNAVERGLRRKPWVKSSLAPGSKVVTDYLSTAGLLPYLDDLGFQVVGYGCTTCIGASGPLPEPVADAVVEGDLAVCAVLSGNRNFEARIHPLVKANYLASPPLVIAYALAGRIDIDLLSEPLGVDERGVDVFLRDLWPDDRELDDAVKSSVRAEMFSDAYRNVFAGDDRWAGLAAPSGERYAWDPCSDYVRRPPYFDGMTRRRKEVRDIIDARCLVKLGDSVTTDHVSPAGAIPATSTAGRYLAERGIKPKDFNTYATRRGNHEVMTRGAFGNVRLRNHLLDDREGGWTVYLPDGEEMSIFDAARRYRAEDIPLIVLAGSDYGVGSSRDWGAKGPRLLGVRAVIAESYERIHRSNLLMMGVLPLQFEAGDSVERLRLTGRETFSILGIDDGMSSGVVVRADDREFGAEVRLDTARERDYFRHGGILPYVLRGLLEDAY